MTAKAQTTVSTDSELRAAIQNNNANITVTADINLSNSTLSIESGKTVTIDLGGHTLDRKLTQRGEGGGQVITVRSGATLNLSNGTLKGGWGGDSGGINNEGGTANLTDVNITGCVGDDRGGGICNRSGSTLTMTGGSITNNISNDHGSISGGGGLFNASGATATLTGVTITGNEAKVTGGGGICNLGTLTVDGCTIQNNVAKTEGGGIWTETGKTLNMQGAMTVTGNTKAGTGLTNNLFLRTDAVITVTGALTGGGPIGIKMDAAGTFTSGYSTYNSGVDPATIFTPDLSGVMAVSLVDNEAQLASALPEGSAYYIERSWDKPNNVVKTEIKTLESGSYTLLTGGDDINLSPGYYVVKGNVRYFDINLVNGGDHHIILCDGARLQAGFIKVEGANTLHIYGQTNDSGKLYAAEGYGKHAAIGGGDRSTNGPIFIHGGDIFAQGCPGCSGIGGGYLASGGDITIYGGKTEAVGGRARDDSNSGDDYDYGGGAGIGGGWNGNGGKTTIYGGNVQGKGTGNGAGIGGGGKAWDTHRLDGGTIEVWGGIVKGYGGDEAAGIGGGYYSEGAHLTVKGGEVYGYGGDRGAGIGGGRNGSGVGFFVNGGYVYARGGIYAAGVGSGCEASFGDGQAGGIITISGGKVEAYGGIDGAGIGGGEDADGGEVTISGGYVIAQGAEGGAGIGGGEDGDGRQVTIIGGTVIARGGRNQTGYRAIGPGEGSDEYGSLKLNDPLMVSSERMATAGERKNMCWYRAQVRVEDCTHKDPTYTVTGNGLSDTHTAHCKYCLTEFNAEQHNFVNEVCTVCGIEENTTVHTIKVYLPAVTGYAEPIEYKFLHGAKFNLPTPPETPEMYIPQNMAFAAWVEGNTPSYGGIKVRDNDNLLYAGTDYIVERDTNLIARYNEIWITLHNDKHNGENLAIYNGKLAREVVLSGRTLYRDGRWNTLCLPFDLDANELKNYYDSPMVKTLGSSSYDSSTGTLTLNFEDVTDIEAGKPYIVKWARHMDDLIDPVFMYVTISTRLYPVTTTAAEGITVTFAGAFSPMFIRQENKSLLYLEDNNKLFYPDGETTLGSCRAHFRLTGFEASGAPVTNVKTNLGNDFGTGISLTPDLSPRRGEQDDAVYNLSGQRLSKPQKGVNIVNGRKVLY